MTNKSFRDDRKKKIIKLSKVIDTHFEALCKVAEACQPQGRAVLIETPTGDFYFQPRSSVLSYKTTYSKK